MPEETIRRVMEEEFQKNEAKSRENVSGLMLWKVLTAFLGLCTTAISVMWLRSENNHDKSEAYWKAQAYLKDSLFTGQLIDRAAAGEKYFGYYQKEIEINRDLIQGTKDLIEGTKYSLDTVKKRQYNFLKNQKQK